MKTQILQLETYDDLVSACDKMKWAKADRILLVWPARNKILNRKLDLLILKRQSISQGAQLALVTHDANLRTLAHQQGIPTFSSIRRAQSNIWRLPRRFRSLQNYHSPIRNDLATHRSDRAWNKNDEKQRVQVSNTQHPILRLSLFLLGVLSFLSLTAMLYPSAMVTIQPATQWQEASLVVIPVEGSQQVSIDGSVPARKVTVVVEGRDSLSVSGTVIFPDTHAIGEVLFTNLTDQPLDIPKNVVIRSADGQRFGVSAPAILPAGSGETIIVPVRSLLPGSAGNLPSGAIEAIEGNLSSFMSVTNPDALHSGKDRRLPTATKSDQRVLAQKLRDELYASAASQLLEQLSPGDYLIPESVQFVQTLEESYSPSDDSPTNQLSLSLQQEYQAYYLSNDDLQQLFGMILNANMRENYQPVQESLTYTTLPNLGNEPAGESGIRITVRRKIREIVPPSQVLTHILGLTPAQAQEQLSNRYTLQAPTLITIQPEWWPRLPFIPLRITIQVID